MKKISINKLIKKIKSGDFSKAVQPKVAPPVVRNHRERDMRAEAMDMGAHGAKDYFGGKHGTV